MQHEVRIVKSLNMWWLQIMTFTDEFPRRLIQNTLIDKETLVDALDVANMLRIHVDNADELPITQYLNQEIK